MKTKGEPFVISLFKQFDGSLFSAFLSFSDKHE